jgi:SecY interacting protein Syd
MSAVTAALDRFVERYREAYPQLYELYDPAWRSPCESGPPFTSDSGLDVVPWHPVRRGYADDFAGLERALETPIHPDIKAYYGRYWSAGLEATAPDGHVSLLFLWNPQDVDRLIENLIGHAMAKQRAKSGFSVFFACTEPDSELFLAVDNASGAVLLERPGYAPVRTVADSLAEFIDLLEPAAPDLHPERIAVRPV